MTVRRRVELALAVGLFLAQGALVTAMVALAQLGRAVQPFASSSLALDVASAASDLTFAAVGLVIVARRPGNTIGWLFILANLGWGLASAATAYVEYASRVAPLPSTALAAWLATWPGPLSLAAYVLLVVLFPAGRPPSRRWRGFAAFVVGWGVLHAALAAFASGPIESLALNGLVVGNPLAAPDPLGGVLADLAYGVLELLAVVLFAVAALSLIVRLRRARGTERQQLKWLTYAVALTAGCWLADTPIMVAWSSLSDAPDWARLANAVLTNAGFVIPLGAAVAILRHRLYEIDRIISRTISYAIVTVLLGGAYAAAFLGLEAVLAPLTEGEGPVAVAVSTLVVFALFAPVRSRISALVDRRFDRRRYDAEHEVQALIAHLRDETDLTRLAGEVEATVRGALAPSVVAIWTRGE